MATEYAPGTLGWWMDDRRAELNLTWDELVTRSGVSKETLFRAAQGRPMRTTTKKAIERALRWTSTSVDDIRRGGEPTPLPEDPGNHADSERAIRLAELEELQVIVRSLSDYAERLRDRLDSLHHEGEQRQAR
jgi:transcriptional regulator with XRE-family HTH domain